MPIKAYIYFNFLCFPFLVVLYQLFRRVEDKERLIREEQKSAVKEFEDRINSHKPGLEAYDQSLANYADHEKSKCAKLKAIAAKTGPKAGDEADKEKKSRPKRDKNKNKENKE